MRVFKVLLYIMSITFIVGCQQDQLEKCEEGFVSAYQDMGDQFVAAYKPYAGEAEKSNLQESIDRFLADYSGVTCEIDNVSVSPTSEVMELKEQLEKSLVVEARFSFSSKVIYGIDNRVDVSESASDKHKLWAKSTLAQMSPSKWDDQGNIISETLGESYNLCSSERFHEQKNPARCSGFLVGPDTVVTAGHCVTTQSDCQNFRWVTDFVKGSDVIASSQVYHCKEIVKQVLDNSILLDYAVIKLDRQITDRKYFRVQASSKVSDEADLVLIGHPSGLPTKIADGGRVRDNSNEYFFAAELDAYGGNSGSAVINEKTGAVEGILVRGEVDYIWGRDDDGKMCRVSNVCTGDQCRGESVTRMSQVEGISAMIAMDELAAVLYGVGSAPVSSEGWILEYASYEHMDEAVGGRRFLDRCGVHYYEIGSPADWKSFYSGECKEEENFKTVLTDFSQAFYL